MSTQPEKKSALPALRTPQQARDDLESKGLSIADFARTHDLPYSITYQVLTGQKKGRRGEAHRAAVLLGLKKGVVLPVSEGA